ncbi:MAG: O-antigen ligase family protein [Anaerolineae bacterium]|nr:O-antigen ligase family protein [Anaerolineae bacterium]
MSSTERREVMAGRLHQRAGGTLGGRFMPLAAHRQLDSLWGVMAAAGIGILLGTYAVAITYLSRTWATLFTAGLLALFVAMIVRNVRKLLLAILILDIPLQLDINLYYRQDVADLGSLGGLNVSLTALALVGLYSLWLSDSVITRNGPLSKWFFMSFPAGLYVLFAGLSLWAAHDKTLALFEFALVIQLMLIYVYILGTVRTREDVLYIIALLLIALFFESIIIIALRFAGSTIKIAGITGRVDGTRVSGTVGSPNNAGAFIVLSLGAAIGLLMAKINKATNWLAMFAFGSGAIALIFTLSRGGWLAFAVFMGLLSVLALRRGWLSARVVAVVVLVGLVLVLALHNVVIERLTADDRGAAESRIPLMRLAFRMIQDYPILGVGINNSPIMIPSYITPEMGYVWVYGVHNKYLAVWSEMGVGEYWPICCSWG